MREERRLRLVTGDDECPTCLMPRDMCECADPVERARVRAHEDMVLRAAADRAIERGFVQLSRRRGIWARLRDAWWAFWHGLS